MDVDIRHLRIVLTVAEAGSITSAAAALGISQPALSAQLGRIERAFGGPLFDRTHKGVSFTGLGDLVIDRARGILREIDTLRTDALLHRQGGGAIRLSSDSPRFFTRFVTRLYGLGLARSIIPTPHVNGESLMDALLGGRIDAAVVLRFTPIKGALQAHIHERTIVKREPLLVALSMQHPLAGQRAVDLRDLGGDNWILPPGDLDHGCAAAQAAFRRFGIAPRTPFGRQDLAQLWPAVVAGEAVSFAAPTASAPHGAVLRPILGQPMVAKRILRWLAGRLVPSEVASIGRSAALAYQDQLAEVMPTEEWWATARDEERPALAGEFAVLHAP